MRFLTLLGMALVVSPGVAEDWPRFRGPNGAGVARSPAALGPLEKLPVAFKVALPPGYGSPIMAAGRLFVQSTSPDGSERTLHALDPEAGKELWAHKFDAKAARVHRKNSLATGTPAADASHVYAAVYDGTAVSLAAFTFDGKPAWAADLGAFESQHGPGLSPVAFDGRVYVNLDQEPSAEVLAFDAVTGKELWRAKRKPLTTSYCPPVVRALPGGGAELVVASSAGVTAYDPATGRERWDWAWDMGTKRLRAVGTPLVVGDLILASAGDGGGSRSLVCLDVSAAPKLKWELKRDAPYVPSYLAIDGHLYWVTDGGVATCAELTTGKILWAERVVNGSVSASLVAVNATVLAIGENGASVQFRATPEGLETLAEDRLAGPVIATPAVGPNRLVVRAGGTLVGYALR